MDRSLLRNFGVAAHIDAGKTTTSERMLYLTGVEHRVGGVDEGTTVLDWMSEERERGITITSAATTIPWKGHSLNLVDTPGHVDFTVEVERCMRVLDGAVLVLDGVAGVQAQSETVWKQIERHSVPCVAFVNKMDKPGADFMNAIETVRDRLGAPAVPLQVPLYEDETPVGVVDILTREGWRFPDNAREMEAAEVPESTMEDVEVLRAELVDKLAEEDEALLELVCEGKEPELDDIKKALRARVIERSLLPVLCGAAARGMGVQPVLDAVVDYLPSPLDMPPVEAERLKSDEKVELESDPEGPLAALSFKLHAGPHGDLCFLRIYSGTLAAGTAVLNTRTGKRERINRMVRIHADGGEDVKEVVAGDIIAVVGPKATGTGDTLCSEGWGVVLETVEFPDPVITRVVEPSSANDRDKLRQGLERLAHEDPSLRVVEEEDSGQWSVSGMGELHLEIIEHRLRDEFKVDARVGKPRVAYREAITQTSKGEASVDRVIGGKDVYAKVAVEVSPAGLAGEGVQFDPGCSLGEKWRHGLENALLQEAGVGPRFGFPMDGVSVRVLSTECRDGNESEAGYGLAGISALREALGGAGVAVQEPLMHFTIEVPGEFSSGVIADLNTRSAEINEVVAEGEMTQIGGLVPLSAMFGYSTAVRSLSQGRADFSMEPAGYRGLEERELEARGLVWS
ncbi:MAG: elongation factor G [Planctomycetes bacterium]|nr:elongation factor G [Planctomycetota bacterium]